MEKEKHQDVFSIITDRIIQLLHQGIVPWYKPWGGAGIPRNLMTGIPFKDVNLLHLLALGFSKNLFISFKQLKEVGAEAKEGEKPYPIAYWKWPEESDKTKGKKLRPLLRYYSVYNVAQCKGIPKGLISKIESVESPRLSCEDLVKQMPNQPEILHKALDPYYEPQDDYVNLPSPEFCITAEQYYANLFYQLIHSTGHTKRLNRKDVMEYLPSKLETYSSEHLIAEIGSCFLQGHAGIREMDPESGVEYIQGWINFLLEDTKAIIYASSQAQKAVDYILSGNQNDPEAGMVKEEGHPTFVSH